MRLHVAEMPVHGRESALTLHPVPVRHEQLQDALEAEVQSIDDPDAKADRANASAMIPQTRHVQRLCPASAALLVRTIQG